MNRKKSLLLKLAVWFEDYWTQILITTGSVGLALAGILPGLQGSSWSWLWSKPYGYLFMISVLLTVGGGIASWQQAPGIQTLKEKVAKQEDALVRAHNGYYELLEYELQILFEILQFTSNERISVYKHEGQTFTMLGRYSSNPVSCQTGRGIYPDDQGCIGVAWRDGKAFVDDLPSPGQQKYFSRLEKEWNINKDVANNLRMKSQSYAAYAIQSYNNGRRIAVIVFESINPGTINDDELQKILKYGESRRIALFLERMNGLEPASTYALEKGY